MLAVGVHATRAEFAVIALPLCGPVLAVSRLPVEEFQRGLDQPLLWFLENNQDSLTTLLKRAAVLGLESYDIAAQPLLDQLYMVTRVSRCVHYCCELLSPRARPMDRVDYHVCCCSLS